MPEPDLYKVLQVDSEADVEVIQAAYRRLAQKYHPDLASDRVAAERMKALNAAWEVLRDPARRAAYDATRSRVDGLPQRGGAGQAFERRTRYGADPSFGEGSRGATSPGPSSGAHSPGGDSSASSFGARSGGDSSASSFGARSGGDSSRTSSGSSPSEARDSSGPRPHPPEAASRDWTSGRSWSGGGYDPRTMGASDGYGAAGPPPGGASGSILSFGRYAGWSLGEIGRTDIDYLEWLDRAPIGRQYRDEIDRILRQRGRRRSAEPQEERRGLFRRR